MDAPLPVYGIGSLGRDIELAVHHRVGHVFEGRGRRQQLCERPIVFLLRALNEGLLHLGFIPMARRQHIVVVVVLTRVGIGARDVPREGAIGVRRDGELGLGAILEMAMGWDCQGGWHLRVCGSEEEFIRTRPLLLAVGENALHVGPSGAGTTVKLANTTMVALNMLAETEGLSIIHRSAPACGTFWK